MLDLNGSSGGRVLNAGKELTEVSLLSHRSKNLLRIYLLERSMSCILHSRRGQLPSS